METGVANDRPNARRQTKRGDHLFIILEIFIENPAQAYFDLVKLASCSIIAHEVDMATYNDLSLHVRLFMRGYPFSRYRIDPPVSARLKRPLNESRIALVTTAGLRAAGQEDFDHSIKMGDPSFREISNQIGDIDIRMLVESHRSYAFDRTGIRDDMNLVFPLDRFDELESKNLIGQLNHRHFSFMGSIVGPRRLIEETAPRVADMLREDNVDAVFLTPV